MYKHKDPHFVMGNEFKCTFEWNEHVLSIMKAADEETDSHYIVAYVPEIKELGVQQINFPMYFQTQQQRDFEFDDFSVTDFMNYLISEIKNRQNENKPESNQSS